MTIAQEMNVVRTLMSLDRREVKLQLATLLEILPPLAHAHAEVVHEMAAAELRELRAFSEWLERLAPYGDEESSQLLREYAAEFRENPEPHSSVNGLGLRCTIS